MRRQYLFWIILLAGLLVLTSCPGDGESTAKSSDDDQADEPAGSTDGCERVPIPPLEPPDLTQGPSVVTLDEHGTFIVNGVKFWPYGFYRYPDEEDMDEFIDAGFNASVFYGGCCGGDSLQEQIDQLAYLRDHGIMGAPHAFQPVDQIYSEDEATLRQWLQARIDVGSVLFWYTYDEPALWSIAPGEAGDYHDLLHDLDPDHPNALVEAALEDFTEYMPYTDFMMIDPYPAPAYPLTYVRETYREAHEASGGAKRVMGVGQAFDWYVMYTEVPEDHVWRPTVHEMRNMTYQYLVLGANGLVYFAYNYVHSQPDRWAGLLEVAYEVKELMPLLVEPNSDVGIVCDADHPGLDWAVKELEGIYYLLIVSTWYNDLTITFDLSAVGEDMCVLHYFDETPVNVEKGAITVTIPGEGDAVLQIIPE